MELFITLTNALSVLAFFAIIILFALIRKEGDDERAQFMGFKLLRFLYIFLFIGLSSIIAVTGWVTLDYKLLRVLITSLMSSNILLGLGYWLYISKKS